MDQILQIFTFLADCIKDYLLFMNSHWLTQIIMYTVVLGFVVSTLIIMRGK